MSILKQSVIREIAIQVATGKTCYLHKKSAEVTIIDNSIEGTEEIAAQKQIQVELDKKIEDYVKVENLNSKYQRMIMKDFLEEVLDKSVSKQLSNALNRKNPVRNFKQVVESDMELSQHWRNFSIGEYQRWISEFLIDTYNY